MASADRPLRPLGLLGSLFYFGIPCAVFSASILGLLPWLIRHGYQPFLAFNLTFGGPLGLMLIAALVGYRLEGRPWTWPAFRDRMRLTKMTGSDWLWTIGLVVVAMVLGNVVGPLANRLGTVVFYRAPAEFTTFMTGMGGGDFGGMSLLGRWDVLFLFVAGLVILNIGGEELWWRGFILPRQELALGGWAWLANGLLWNLFHFFYHTNLGSVVAYLPATLPLAFVAQRTGKTWPGLVAHLIANGGVAVAIFFKVIGR